jgi:hypothetical protein
MNHNIKCQNGSSLLAAMVSAALLGGVLIAIMQSFNFEATTRKAIKSQMASKSLDNAISTIISRKLQDVFRDPLTAPAFFVNEHSLGRLGKFRFTRDVPVNENAGPPSVLEDAQEKKKECSSPIINSLADQTSTMACFRLSLDPNEVPELQMASDREAMKYANDAFVWVRVEIRNITDNALVPIRLIPTRPAAMATMNWEMFWSHTGKNQSHYSFRKEEFIFEPTPDP